MNVLVSGGIDSAALLVFYQQQKFSVRALFVDFGQPAAKQELRAVRSVCRHYRVRVSTATVRTRATFSLGEIPGRNAFLIFTATLMNGKEPGVIAIGIHEGLPYYDCGEGFVAAVQAIVDGYSAGSVKIAAPFLKWSKPTIWAFCKKHKVPIHLMLAPVLKGASLIGLMGASRAPNWRLDTRRRGTAIRKNGSPSVFIFHKQRESRLFSA